MIKNGVKSMNVGMILAGGRGVRFGEELPKQYTEVMGKPVLAYTLEVFQKSEDIDAIQIVCQPEFFDRVKEIARDYNIDKLRWVANGGDSCPTSIRNGLYDLRDKMGDDDIVVMHMSVSPLITTEDIAAAVRVCREKGCCYTMHPVNICMAQGGGVGWADKDAPKEKLIELNSPWVFHFGDVYDLYRKVEANGKVISPADYTINLWFEDGRKAWYTPGCPAGRMKITTTHDRDLFEGYLLLQQQRNKN